MSEQPCHTGKAARTCGYCAERDARTERTALAWHDVICPEGPDCRTRQLHAHSEPVITSGIADRFLARLAELEQDPTW